MIKKILFRILILIGFVGVLYGCGRLYYQLTGGFALSNISSDFAYNPEWETRPLREDEQAVLDKALDQPYDYLGKGCQSYVFVSRDGEYVVKFFKYQRFRMQPWLAYFPPLPNIVKYRQEKMEKKWHKLDGFVKSWKIAFEELKSETGLVFVHLNKTDNLMKELLIQDKMGNPFLVNLDEMEFCVQHRATMLCDTLMEYKAQHATEQAQELITKLLALIISEYHRGLADNDHALMQNTGIVNGNPIHIDVGQFVHNEMIKDPEVYRQELFTKTYKFKLWLREEYPELAPFLDAKLREIIGPSYEQMQPKFRDRTKR